MEALFFALLLWDEADQMHWGDISIGLSAKSCQGLIPSHLLRIIRILCRIG